MDTLLRLGAAAALALVGAGCNGAPPQQPELPAVVVANPAVERVALYEEVVGRFQAAQAVEVRPQVTGRLLRAHFTDGQMVRRGDVLFTIDAAPSQAEVDRARALAAEARARQALAASELKRAEALRALDAISAEEFDQRQQAALTAQAGVTAAEAAVRAAQVTLNYTTVRAPFAGRVSDRRADPGALVVADQTVLTTVVSQDPIHFEFSLQPDLAAALPRPVAGKANGVEAQLQLEGETGFPHQGRLDFLDNQVDPRTGVVRGRAVFANPDGRFIPGRFARLRLARGVIEDATLVPESAISSDQTNKYVLVAAPGEGQLEGVMVAAPAPVQLGPLIEGRRVVTGLDRQAQVIVRGGARVFPGQPIAPQTEAAAEGVPPAAEREG